MYNGTLDKIKRYILKGECMVNMNRGRTGAGGHIFVFALTNLNFKILTCNELIKSMIVHARIRD